MSNNNDNDEFSKNYIKQRPRRMINISFPSSKYGLFFAIVAIIDGYKSDDPYPNYGNIDRRRNNTIKKYRKELSEAEAALETAVNTMTFRSVSLSKKIKDDPTMLAFVDESLATCSSLKKRSPNKINTKK